MIGTVSNILVILAVLLTRQLREICTAVLLISLLVTDVIICAVYQLTNIVDINYGSSAITVRLRLGFGFFLASLSGELIVTVDRFIYIRSPYHYLDWTSTKYVVVSAFCAQWFLAILFTLLTFISGLIYTGAVYITVVFVSTVALHISMYCIASRQTRKINNQYPAHGVPEIGLLEPSNCSGDHGSGCRAAALGTNCSSVCSCTAQLAVFQALHKIHFAI